MASIFTVPTAKRFTYAFDQTVRSGQKLALGLAKRSYHLVSFSPIAPKAIGLIMGVQRSGTGAMVQAFENDWNCRTFGEDGGLALGENAPRHMRWRWKPYDEVARLLQRERAPLLIAKPLVESQNARAILEHIPEARIIWAFRDYRDVALSGQKHFGSERIKFNLRTILEGQEHWYSENVDEKTRNLVVDFYDERRPIYDLRALGWLVRNSLVFQYDDPPIVFSNYDDLVTNPGRAMRRLYDFLERPYPGDHVVRHLHPRSVKRGSDVGISHDIRQLCEGMLEGLVERSRIRLPAVEARRPPRFAP
jgi:hypothetical protein